MKRLERLCDLRCLLFKPGTTEAWQNIAGLPDNKEELLQHVFEMKERFNEIRTICIDYDLCFDAESYVRIYDIFGRIVGILREVEKSVCDKEDRSVTQPGIGDSAITREAARELREGIETVKEIIDRQIEHIRSQFDS